MGNPNLHTQLVIATRFISVFLFVIVCSLFTTSHLQAQASCNNVTSGGSISGEETGCANPTFDPSLITSIQAPTGGSGAIEYLWMKTTGDPTAPFNAWDIIPRAKGETYDPLPISTTTHYARCSRRALCSDYNGETNVITKTVHCCTIDVQINRLGGSACTNEVALSATAPAGAQISWSASSGSFNNPNGRTTTFTAGSSGSVTIFLTATSSDGCEGTSTLPLTIGGVETTTTVNQPSCGESNGSVTVNVSGGVAPLQYDWGDAFPNSPTITNLSGGVYIVIVTDANGCSSTSTAQLNSAGNLNIDFQSQNVSCPGSADGMITIQANNGVSPYTYQWTNNISTTASASNLPSGAYQVTVSDASGCSNVANITVLDSPPISATITPNNSCGVSGGQATVNVGGGSPGYTYLWSDALQQTSSTATNLVDGTYTITVTDAAGCTTTATTSISTTVLELSASVSQPGCAETNTGVAGVIVVNGVAPYSYLWSNGISGQATIANLSEGEYTVTVTDAAGCSATELVEVVKDAGFDIVVNTVDASCNENNGRAVVNFIGPDQIYDYRWNDINNTRSSAAENLTPGIYTVTVTAPDGCSIERPASVGRIPSEFSAGIEANVTTVCLGEFVELAALITGQPVSYVWSTPNGELLNPSSPTTSYIASIEGEQTISLFVTDAFGCQENPTITINVVNAFGGQISSDKPGICVDNDIQDIVTITLAGTTTATNTFVITDEADNIIGVQTSNQFDFETGETGVCFIRNVNYDPSLTSGLVKGQNLSNLTGCFGISNAVRIDRYSGEDCKILCNLEGGNISTGDVPVVCVGDGTPDLINVAVAGNTGNFSTWVVTDIHETVLSLPTAPPFDFEGTGEGISFIWHISSDIPMDGLVVGSSLTNLPGCGVLSNNSIKVDRRTASSFNIIPSANILCPNSSVQLTTDWPNNYGSFSWSVSGGSFDDSNSASPIFTPAGTGSFTLTAQLFDGVCSSLSTTTIIVQEPINIAFNGINETCPGDRNGRIDLSVSGGTAPYTYLWADSSSTSAITQLSAGTYGITITDANGCSASSSIPIANDSNLSAQVGTQSLACFGDNSGVILIEATGGVEPYTYLWNGQPNNNRLANLVAGTYTIEVRDSFGCSVVKNTNLTQPDLLTVGITNTGFTCQTNGTATAVVTGGTGVYSYQWNDALNSSTASISNLAPGTYQVFVTDSNGCTAIANTTILEESITNCQISVVNAITSINGTQGHLQAEAAGGTSYQYIWSNGSTERSINNLSSGEYSLTVTDEFGCSCADTVKLKNPAKIGDLVFEDKNDNGIQDAGEDGLRGVGITLSGRNEYGEEVLLTTKSDKQGMYMFVVIAGTYKITVTDYLNLKISNPDAGEEHLDSDIDPITLMSPLITVVGGEFYGDLDVGLVPKGFCDNVLTGGSIGETEELCRPKDDPALIYNQTYPTGGSGELEYLWLHSTQPEYTPGHPAWFEIPNSNEEFLDPDSIHNTTYYIRCVRRKGCDNYPGETNVIGKILENCVTSPNAEHLRVTPMDNEMMLEWTGNIPVEQSHFVIEHSQDGEHFQTIGSANAFHSESYTAYDYMDKTPSMGENYYRIKTVHPTMGYTFSNIAMAMFKPSANARVTLYPNPVNDELNIHFLEARTEPAILEIANGFGQVIHQITIDIPTTQYTVPLQNLPGGIYYVKFQNRTLKRYSQKIIKRE